MSLPAKKDGGGLPAIRATKDEGIMDWISQPALQLDEELQEQLEAAQDGLVSVIVRPPKSASGDVRAVAEKFFKAVHGDFSLISMEIHQTDSGEVEFHTIVHEGEEDRLITFIRSATDDGAEVDVEDAPLPIAAGDVVVGSRLDYDRDHIFPLQTARSPTDDGDDPYGPLLSLMEDSFGAKTIIQLTAVPVQPTGVGGRLHTAASRINSSIRPTWTTRWSRWPPKSLRHERRAWLPSLIFSAVVGGAALAAWTLIGGWPLQATPLWAFSSGGDLPLAGQIAFWAVMVMVAALALVSTLGDGLSLWRLTAKEMAERFRDRPRRRSTSDERASAEVIGQQSGEPGFRVSMRMLTAAESAQKARSHHGQVIQQVQNATHNPTTHQQLVASHPRLKRRRISLIRQAAARSTRTAARWQRINKLLLRSTRRRPAFMAPFELALAHWPEKTSGGSSVVRFASVTDAEHVPPHANDPDDTGDEPVSAGPPQPELGDEPARSAPDAVPEPDIDAGTNAEPTEPDEETETETQPIETEEQP